MTQNERDEWFLAVLNKYFIPYEYTKDDINTAAKQIADAIDKEIINSVIETAKKEEKL